MEQRRWVHAGFSHSVWCVALALHLPVVRPANYSFFLFKLYALCVYVCTFLFRCTLAHAGQVNAFGVFQAYYAKNQLQSSSASNISWIGGVQIALLYISGLVLGRVFDKYGARVSHRFCFAKNFYSPSAAAKTYGY